jgi:hypothetical protein
VVAVAVAAEVVAVAEPRWRSASSRWSTPAGGYLQLVEHSNCRWRRRWWSGGGGGRGSGGGLATFTGKVSASEIAFSRTGGGGGGGGRGGGGGAAPGGGAPQLNTPAGGAPPAGGTSGCWGAPAAPAPVTFTVKKASRRSRSKGVVPGTTPLSHFREL